MLKAVGNDATRLRKMVDSYGADEFNRPLGQGRTAKELEDLVDSSKAFQTLVKDKTYAELMDDARKLKASPDYGPSLARLTDE